MKFVIDAQLPPVMARWLEVAGHEAIHVGDIGLRNSDDDAIWTHALNAGLLIVTKDEDFVTRATADATAPVIVWLRIGNATNAVLRAWFEPRLAGIVQMANEGNRVIEVI